MKHLKKALRKKTVEAYSCVICGSPEDCIIYCSGSIYLLNEGAGIFGAGIVPQLT